jgi:nitroreductase
MRRLKADPVPEGVLVRLIDAANQAPSGSNAQNTRWIVVRDPAQKAQLAALNRVSATWYLKQQRKQLDGVSHQSAEKRARMMEAVEWQMEHMHEVPAIVIACVDLPGGRADNFLAGALAGSSVWPGVQNLLLAARALGLGATLTTLGLMDREKVKAVLTLPEAMEAFCLIPVGYPMGRFGAVARKPVAEVMRWDRWT